MFIEAVIPNSFRSLLSVKMNVEKPQAVVKFVIKDAFPILNQIQKQYSKNEVLVVGINVDRDKKLMKRFLKKNDCNFLILHDASKDLVSKMDLKTFPTSFVVDSNKIIKSVHTGFNKKTTKKNYIKVINELISKKTTNDK